jgi:ribosome recycling factor
LSSTKETVVTSSSQSAPNINEEEKTQPTKTAKEGKKSENVTSIRNSSRNTKHHAEHDDNEENNTSDEGNDEYNKVNMSILLVPWIQKNAFIMLLNIFV